LPLSVIAHPVAYLHCDEKQDAQSNNNRSRYDEELIQALSIDVAATEVISGYSNQSAQGIRNDIGDVRRTNCEDVLDGLSRNAGAEYNEQLVP